MNEQNAAGRLAECLLTSYLCTSKDEAEITAQELVDYCNEEMICWSMSSEKVVHEILSRAIVDYFGIPEKQANDVVRWLAYRTDDNDHSSSSDSFDDSHSENNDRGVRNSQNETECAEEEEEYLGDGECEMCERYVKLTAHHLIPKSTWPKIRTKLSRLSPSKKQGRRGRRSGKLSTCDEDATNTMEIRTLLGLEDRETLPAIDPVSLKRYLSTKTCSICRQCHSTVHSTHDNVTLAETYNSVEKLLQDETIYKFCKWANKQRPGKQSRRGCKNRS